MCWSQTPAFARCCWHTRRACRGERRRDRCSGAAVRARGLDRDRFPFRAGPSRPASRPRPRARDPGRPRPRSDRRPSARPAILVVVEVALAMMLVTCAALLLRTVYNLTRVDAGFDRSRLVTFSMTLPRSTKYPEGRAQVYQRLLDTLGTLRAFRPRRPCPIYRSAASSSGCRPA